MTESDGSSDGLDSFLNDFYLPYSPEEQSPAIVETEKPIEFVNKLKFDRAQMTNLEKAFGKRTLNYKSKWRQVIQKLGKMKDPWDDFPHVEAKDVRRYRYDVETKRWTVDSIKIKIEDKPFSRGSMRQCYRMKCLTNFSQNNWRNSVAKRYIEYATFDTYRNDVIMQDVAKRWSELYNRANPPKKIDMVQLGIIETEEGFYHVEPFMVGHYVKYNSNCGFVDSCMRNTPQAFSHFTFERSGHTLMVVDIQGVDDMYTDPQIHTHDGGMYGEGNLGIRGIALFFHSHVCSTICASLGLSQFEMTQNELKSHVQIHSSTLACEDLFRFGVNGINPVQGMSSSPVKCNSNDVAQSDRSDITFDDRLILSKVHHQLALYHEMGRFVDVKCFIDWKAYDFHENIAVKLDNPEATENLAKIYLNLVEPQFDVEKTLNKPIETIRSLGVCLMIKCAEVFKLPYCLRYVAHSLMEGSGLYEMSEKNWESAADLLEDLIQCGQGEYFEATHMHLFMEKANLAKLYMTGGHRLARNVERAEKLLNEAANEALSINYVNQAMSYFELAEECQM